MEPFQWFTLVIAVGALFFEFVFRKLKESAIRRREAERLAKGKGRREPTRKQDGAHMVKERPSIVKAKLHERRSKTAFTSVDTPFAGFGVPLEHESLSQGSVLLTDKEALRRAILVSEIVGVPRALKPYKPFR